MRRLTLQLVIVTLVLFGLVAAAGADSKLPDATKGALGKAKYVYISSTREDGSLSKPAEIWFMYKDGAVYVGTSTSSWRVKRIKVGRTGAKIWVGKPDGPSMFNVSQPQLKDLPSFDAFGSIVDDPKVQEAMLKAYATKYPEGWSKHEANFRNGFKDGSRVVVKYTPM